MNRIWRYVAGLFAGMSALLAAWAQWSNARRRTADRKAREANERADRERQTREAHTDAQQRKRDIDDAVRGLTGDERRERLRGYSSGSGSDSSD